MYPLRISNNASPPSSNFCNSPWRATNCVVGLSYQAVGKHQQNRQSETPNSLLIVTDNTLWRTLPVVLNLPDGRVKQPPRFASVARGAITRYPPPLCSRRVADGSMHVRHRHGIVQVHKATDMARIERASSAYRRTGVLTIAAHGLRAEPHAPGK